MNLSFAFLAVTSLFAMIVSLADGEEVTSHRLYPSLNSRPRSGTTPSAPFISLSIVPTSSSSEESPPQNLKGVKNTAPKGIKTTVGRFRDFPGLKAENKKKQKGAKKAKSVKKGTHSPSLIPSDVPSDLPSDQPSNFPSSIPSAVPTFSQAPSSSVMPSTSPSLSHAPSVSSIPSDSPSYLPSDLPSSFPSDAPSAMPSSMPSCLPPKGKTGFLKGQKKAAAKGYAKVGKKGKDGKESSKKGYLPIIMSKCDSDVGDDTNGAKQLSIDATASGGNQAFDLAEKLAPSSATSSSATPSGHGTKLLLLSATTCLAVLLSSNGVF